MRIALVIAGGVDRSGHQRVIPALLWLIERLARRHFVHVFVLRHYEHACTYPLLGSTVHDLGRPTGPRGLQSARQLPRLVRALRAAGPFDVVHGYWATPSGLLTAIAGRWLRIPTLVTFDSGELVCLRSIDYGLQCSRRGRWTVRLTAALASRIHVCSEYMEQLARAAGLDTVRIPLGVDRRAFEGDRGDRASGPPWRLLHVASLNRVKDQFTLLRALSLVIEIQLDVHLDIVGEDTLGGALATLCTALKLDAHVSFHGFQPTVRLGEFYRRAHLLVLPSRHEAAGVVVLEAAACGVPTVGTAAGYIADWSPGAACGVPAGDEAALADAIVNLLSRPGSREQLAREAAARVRSYDADATTAALEQVYGALV
jgi:glycosyltransferase involved in cell wall biosynthesis